MIRTTGTAGWSTMWEYELAESPSHSAHRRAKEGRMHGAQVPVTTNLNINVTTEPVYNFTAAFLP